MDKIKFRVAKEILVKSWLCSSIAQPKQEPRGIM